MADNGGRNMPPDSNKRHAQTNRGNNQTKQSNKLQLQSCIFGYQQHLSQLQDIFWSASYQSQFVSSHTDANFNSSHLILCLGKKKISPSAQTKMTPGGAHHYTIWLTFIIPVWE